MSSLLFSWKNLPSIHLRCNQASWRDGDCVNHCHPHRPVVLCHSVLLLLQEVCRLCKVKIFVFLGGGTGARFLCIKSFLSVSTIYRFEKQICCYSPTLIRNAVVCPWPVCYGVSACRHSAIFCPVIPEPSVMFKEMMSGNREPKVHLREKSNLMMIINLSASTYHTILCRRPSQGTCTSRWKSTLSPAKLCVCKTAVSSSRSRNVPVYRAVPAMKLDLWRELYMVNY